MINDPKLVALADAMIRWTHLELSDGKGEIDGAGGPAFVRIDGTIDFEALAAVAMAALGIEFEWADHDGSYKPPVDAKGLTIDMIGDHDPDHVLLGYRYDAPRWQHVKRWRPSLDNWR